MVIIMLGAPGTGKGTTAGVLSDKLNIPQVATGDIFRKHISEGTELGKLAGKYLATGALVPDEVTIKLIEDRLQDEDVKEGIILDGFPRNVFQAESLDKLLANHNRKVDIVINLTTPKEEIIQRVVNRRVCSNQNCKTIYNLVLKPSKVEGICDICGAKLVQRKDDNLETIESRLQTYFDVTSPLVEYYEKQGSLYQAEVSEQINKLGKDVANDVVKLLKGED